MREQQLDRESAAKEFAEQIRKLAENGHIDTLSINIYDWDCDNLFRLAKKVGVKELCITAISGMSSKEEF